MNNVFDELKENLQAQKHKKIMLPETTDTRIIKATRRIKKQKIVTPILIGNEDRIIELSKKFKTDISNCEIIDPVNYERWDEMLKTFIEKRNGKIQNDEAEKK